MSGKGKNLEDEGKKKESIDEHGESKRTCYGRSSLDLSMDLSLLPHPYHHQSFSETSSRNKGLSNENSKDLQKELTIFYNGAVVVYDTTVEKANAIMTLASTISGKQSPPDLTQASEPSTPFTNFMLSTKLSSFSTSCSALGSLPLASKSSLQRFLAKRTRKMQGTKGKLDDSDARLSCRSCNLS